MIAASSISEEAPDRRSGGQSYKRIYVAFFGLLLVAGTVAAVMYFKLLHYERAAALHLPPDTTVVARIDVENVVLFEPVRKHLLPLANELRAGDPKLKSRLKRLEQHTRIELAVDLREIAVARGSAPGDWVIVFGGLFPKQNVVSGLRQVFAEEGLQGDLSSDGTRLTLGNGLTLGQAEDGCILIAASAARLESALPRQDTFQRLLLARDGAGGFALAGDFARALADAPFVSAVPELREITRVQGELQLGNPLQISSQVELKQQGEPAEVERRVRATLDALRAFATQPPDVDYAGEARILEKTKPRLAGQGSVELAAPWDRADVDRAAESVARALRAWVDPPKTGG
jgi:hypothetical protein